MICEKCKAHVTKVLNKLEGAEAEVNLEGVVQLKSDAEIADAVFEKTVKVAGYELKGIDRK